MGDVIKGHFITTLDTSAESVLDGAKEHGLDVVFVVGLKGDELYCAGSSSDMGKALVLFERFKRNCIED